MTAVIAAIRHQSIEAALRFAGASIALLSVVFLSSCVRPASETIRIQFAFWGNVKNEQQWRLLADQFEVEHLNTKVDLMRIGTSYPMKLQAMMVGNVAPDVFSVEMGHYYQWAARGVLLDLTDEFRDIDNEHPYMPVVHQAMLYKDRCYALPYDVSGFVTYANLDAIREAGAALPPGGPTWEWIAENSHKLSSRGGDPSARTDYALVLPPTPQVILYGFGADPFDNYLNPSRVTADSPEMREALEYIRRLSQSGNIVPLTLVNTADNNVVTKRNQLFADQRVAFFFSGHWEPDRMPESMPFKWDVFPIPAGPKARVTQHGGMGIAVSKKSKHVGEAKAFAKFITSKKAIDFMVDRAGKSMLPVYREVAYGDAYLSIDPPASRHVYVETMERDASRFIVYAPEAFEVNRIINDSVERMLANPSISIDAIIDGMVIELDRFLEHQKRLGVL